MASTPVDLIRAGLTPWNTDGETLIKELRSIVSCTSMAVGLISGRKASADEVLAQAGFTGSAIRDWCDAGTGKDKLFAAARKTGIATARGKSAGCSLLKTGSAVVCVLPEAPGENRWWWMILARKGGAFSETEQAQAHLILRSWQAEFGVPNEPMLGRLIIGSDDRLIGTDIATRSLLLDEPGLLPELLETLHGMVAQRYPKLPDNDERDMAVHLAGQAQWVVLQRRNVVAGSKKPYWSIELRPMQEDEIIPVGVMEDDRIGFTIGYLHDNYSDTPSLTQTARQVHMSPFHFHRLFSKMVGISPKQYLQRKQLQMSKWMLRAHRVSIGDIAMETGFSSHGHFTSTFHRIIGISPTEYRQSYY